MTEFIETAEQDRNVRQQWILMTGSLMALAAILWICVTIYERTWKPTAPSELKQAIPVGLQSGPYTIPIDNGMITWKVPDGLMEFLLAVEAEKQAVEAAKLKEEAEANEAKKKSTEEDKQAE